MGFHALFSLRSDIESNVFCFALRRRCAQFIYGSRSNIINRVQYIFFGVIDTFPFFHLANCTVFLWSLKAFFCSYCETNQTIELKFRHFNFPFGCHIRIWLNDDNACDDTFSKRRMQKPKIITILVLHSKPQGVLKITVKAERTCCGLWADVLLEILKDARGLNFHNVRHLLLSPNEKENFFTLFVIYCIFECFHINIMHRVQTTVSCKRRVKTLSNSFENS